VNHLKKSGYYVYRHTRIGAANGTATSYGLEDPGLNPGKGKTVFSSTKGPEPLLDPPSLTLKASGHISRR